MVGLISDVNILMLKLGKHISNYSKVCGGGLAAEGTTPYVAT